MTLNQRLLLLPVVAGLSLPGAALAETLAVTDIVMTGERGFRVEIPTIEADDANLDEAAIRAMFSDASYAALASNLSGLDATAIRIPQITVVYDLPAAAGPGKRAEIVYYDLELTNVADGVATSGASLGTIEIAGPDDTVITVGTLTVDFLDLGGVFGFYGFAPEPRSETMTPLYENFQLLGASISSPAFSCEIGPADAERFSARPVKGSFDELMALTAELEAAEASGDTPAPETLSRFITFYADFLTAFESTPTTVVEIACRGSNGVRTFRITADSVKIGGFSPGIYPDLGVNGFRVEADDGWFEIGSFTWKPMDLNGPIAALLEARDQLTERWFENNWRKVIPAFEGFSLSGLAFDIPDAADPDSRFALGIGSMDLSLSEYTNGIPASVAATGAGIVVQLPEDGEGSELRRFGFETLDLGYDIAARWNETDEEILVDRFTVTGEAMGAITVSGVIGNASERLFATNPNTAARAAAGLTVTELTIDIRNDGLVPALIGLMAADENQDPAVFHALLSGAARALPIAMLGATPEALGLGAALGGFLDGKPNLRIVLTAIDPAGIGLNDLMAAQKDPTVLKGKITIEADVSGDAVPFTWPEPQPAPSEPESTPSEALPATQPGQNADAGSSGPPAPAGSPGGAKLDNGE